MVARMSAAICGTAFPRMSLRSSGLRDHRAIDVIARSEFSNGSPHEHSDMRDGLPPDVASLIRATEPTGPSTSLRGVNSAVVARMSAAICGTVFPGCRFRSSGLRDHRATTAGPSTSLRGGYGSLLLPRPHPIPRRRMRCPEPRPAVAEQFFTQRPLAICVLVTPAPNQLGHQHVGDVLEIAGRDRERHVQAIDVGLVNPRLDVVGDLLGRADHHGADAADPDMLDDLAYGPDPIRIGAGDVVHSGAAGVGLDVAQLLVEVGWGGIDR